MRKTVRVTLSWTLLLFFAGLWALTGARAQTLVGYTGYLPEQDRQFLEKTLGEGAGKSAGAFTPVLQKAQKWLDDKYPGAYVLSIEDRAGEGLVVNLQLLLGSVVVNTDSLTGYDAENVRSTLPSLQKGIELGQGQDWFNFRELNQANENPFKDVAVVFDIEPGKPVVANILAQAKDSVQSVVGVDNYGGSTTGRERLSYFYTNANTFGGDEVLRLFGQTTLDNPDGVYALGASYSMPFYGHGQNILFSAVSNRATVENLPLVVGGLSLRGESDQLGFQWTQDLSRWGWGLNDAPRLTLGVSWKKLFNQTTLDGFGGYALNANPTLKELPLQVGLSNAIRFSPSTNFLFSLNGSWYKPTGRNAESFNAARAGAGKGYKLLRYSFGLNTKKGGVSLSATVLGQYTPDKLTGDNQMSVAGLDAVRGFVNPRNSLSGDSVVVGRFQAGLTPTFSFLKGAGGSSKGRLSLYGFFDIGHKKGGSSGTTEMASSVGLGLKYQLPQMSMDAYVAQVLQGRKENNAEKPSVWLKAQVTF